MLREGQKVHYDALDNLKPFLTSLMQSCKMGLPYACCCFFLLVFSSPP